VSLNLAPYKGKRKRRRRRRRRLSLPPKVDEGYVFTPVCL